MVAGQRDIARQGSQLGSQAAWGVQSNADTVALNERDKALQGISGLYGQSLGSSSDLYGQSTKAMEAGTSPFQNILSGVNAATGLVKAFKSK
jgi:hypothetical protein